MRFKTLAVRLQRSLRSGCLAGLSLPASLLYPPPLFRQLPSSALTPIYTHVLRPLPTLSSLSDCCLITLCLLTPLSFYFPPSWRRTFPPGREPDRGCTGGGHPHRWVAFPLFLVSCHSALKGLQGLREAAVYLLPMATVLTLNLSCGTAMREKAGPPSPWGGFSGVIFCVSDIAATLHHSLRIVSLCWVLIESDLSKDLLSSVVQ